MLRLRAASACHLSRGGRSLAACPSTKCFRAFRREEPAATKASDDASLTLEVRGVGNTRHFYVCCWHLADMPRPPHNFRSWG